MLTSLRCSLSDHNSGTATTPLQHPPITSNLLEGKCSCIFICTLTYVRFPITSQHPAKPTPQEVVYRKRISPKCQYTLGLWCHLSIKMPTPPPPSHGIQTTSMNDMNHLILSKALKNTTVSIDLSGSTYCDFKHLGQHQLPC